MSADLIQRLRTRPTGDPYLHMMVHEAANEIERLRADAARLDWLIDAATVIHLHHRFVALQSIDRDGIDAAMAAAKP